MARIEIYTTAWCGYCERAKALLRRRGLEYEEIRVDDDPQFRQRLLDLTGRWTVPQILVDDRPIGGYSELWSLDRSGRLEDLLAA
ncbi:MAG: glutaredoxin 3 [Actinobacteria bacterium]|nr:MAG: glutaredoxin 3 [Actinomycetota bacterium]